MTTESDYNSYKALKSRSPQACLFCEQVFNDRFNSIVHNSSHIIIPLLKHQVHYCEICSFYFNSTEDFNTHISDKHPPVVNNYNKDIKFDIKVPEIKLEKLPQLNGDNLFEVKKELLERKEYDSLSEDESLCDIVNTEAESIYIRDEGESDEEYKDLIKSKLKFEVDHEYNGLKDFTTDCEVNIQYRWSKNLDIETYNNNKQSITNSIVYEEPVDEFEFDNVLLPDIPETPDEEHESVHYIDLMIFGIFMCRYCNVSCSNRFSLIIHETTHLRINRISNRYLLCPQCDIYIVGNYRTVQRHQAAVHGTICSKKLELQTCDMCGLRYRKYSRHIMNYHPKEYKHLESSKNTVKDQVEPFEGTVQKDDCIMRTFEINVCDVCFSFYKNSCKKKYILKGTASYNTERPCHECKNLFLKLKTVKTITQIHKTNQITRTYTRRRYTNEKRLKNIQIRLKMINKLSKFYDDLLIKFLWTYTYCKYLTYMFV